MEQFRFLAENPELLRLNLAGAEAERARLRVQPTRPGCAPAPALAPTPFSKLPLRLAILELEP
jgi:hypothetical protein